MIDAHHHLWDLNKVSYPWLEAKGTKRFFGDPDPIRHNYLPNDFFADHHGLVKQSVHIQVGCLPKHNELETQLIENFIDNGATVAAIVAATDVTAHDLELQLERQLKFKHVRGVRHIIGKSPEENSQLPPFDPRPWLIGWKTIANKGLSFDLQLTSEQYSIVYNTLITVPELRVVICHLGSPWNQSEQGFKHWLYWMKKFAELPFCYIKLSGFAMFQHEFNLAQFLRYSQSAIELFGVNRCMLGSNFPVDKLHMTYQELLSAWQILTSHYNQDEKLWLFEKSAKYFYSI